MSGIEFWIYEIAYWLAGVMYIFPMRKRRLFYVRGLLVISLGSFISYVATSVIDFHDTVKLLIYGIICFILMIIFVYFCAEVSKSVAIYSAMWASVTSYLACEIIVWVAFVLRSQTQGYEWLLYFIMISIFVVIYVLCGTTIVRWIPMERGDIIPGKQLISSCLLYGIIMMIYMTVSFENLVFSAQATIALLIQIICVILMYLQNELYKKSLLRNEVVTMEALFQKEKEQYYLTKENIAYINEKCHDLKHQIRALKHISKEEFDQYLEQMENSIQIYEATVKTGNEVLDTILTEKSLYCKEKGIQISCVADGEQLNFINVLDLYSMLGNALDNAIECVEKISNFHKKQIDVLIYQWNSFVIINILNPIERTVEFKDGIPLTTKKDKTVHGYGIKSIEYIAKKYNGYMTINTENESFSLKLLFPLNEIK